MSLSKWQLDLYRFGGNKPALIIGGIALLLGLFTIIAALTLEDTPVCKPEYAGRGNPDVPGNVIAGQITERDERLDGCKSIAIRVEGYSVPKFAPNQAAFDATANNPETMTVLVLRNMPARYNGLAVGTKLMALYDEQKEAPYAFFFPNGTQQGAGLDIGSDTRTDYSKTRLMLYLGAGVLLFIGISVLAIAWRYPVRWNPPPRSQVVTAPRPPRKPRRPRADPITGEPLSNYEAGSERQGIFGKSDPLPPGADEDV